MTINIIEFDTPPKLKDSKCKLNYYIISSAFLTTRSAKTAV